MSATTTTIRDTQPNLRLGLKLFFVQILLKCVTLMGVFNCSRLSRSLPDPVSLILIFMIPRWAASNKGPATANEKRADWEVSATGCLVTFTLLSSAYTPSERSQDLSCFVFAPCFVFRCKTQRKLGQPAVDNDHPLNFSRKNLFFFVCAFIEVQLSLKNGWNRGARFI